MGFIKFLGKKKKSSTLPEPPKNDLDMPPAPPNLDTNIPSTGLPEFPEIPKEEPIPNNMMDQVEAEKEKIMPEAELKSEVIEMPSAPIEAPPEPQEEEEMTPFEEHSEESSYEYTPLERSYPTKPIFIKAERFQKVLGRLKTGKKLLKITEDKLFKISELKNKEEKEFNLWKNKLEDVQRKLIYVDKVLFEE